MKRFTIFLILLWTTFSFASPVSDKIRFLTSITKVKKESIKAKELVTIDIINDIFQYCYCQEEEDHIQTIERMLAVYNCIMKKDCQIENFNDYLDYWHSPLKDWLYWKPEIYGTILKKIKEYYWQTEIKLGPAEIIQKTWNSVIYNVTELSTGIRYLVTKSIHMTTGEELINIEPNQITIARYYER